MALKIRKTSKVSLSDDDCSMAIELAYRKYFDKLYSYARVVCDSEEMAQDVVSEFFYGLLKKSSDLSKAENLEAYLCVGVKNLCIQHLMKSSKTEKNTALLATIDYVDPQQILLGEELRSLLESLINNLPEKCQLIFRMSKEQGMSNQEIAEELQVGIGTIKTQLIRAHSKLREKIVAHYHDQDLDSTPWRFIGQFLLTLGGI
ncbi:MAG: sigma-70 family RNA polymerase sigma factor [Cyclobacteriaceae bacterium]